MSVQAENAPAYTQPKLKLSTVLTDIPKTFFGTFSYAFQKDAWPAWAVLVGTTGVLYHYDPDIYAGAKNDGQRWGIGNDDHTKTVIKGFGVDLLRLPSDTGSALYFLGDGWVHVMAGVAFFADGYFTDNARAWNTGLEIIHGLAVATIFDQTMKRATGRESPNQATEPRGRFRPFPSIKSYQAHTAQYDAFPSGHIMTATLAFTVINSNYPEYFAYVLPVEILWLGALGFEMVNNGVHWASDYPMGIAIGYAVGKVATHMGVQSTTQSETKKKPSNWAFFPSLDPDEPGVNAIYSF